MKKTTRCAASNKAGWRGLLLAGAMALPAMAEAAMGNLATSYGLLPSDTASAEALSLFNSQVSSTYYNPAYLARDPRGALTVGALYGNNQLTARSDGGSAPLVRDGTVLNGSNSQQVLLGMKTNLSSLTRIQHPIYFGFMLGSEKNGQELMVFNSSTSKQGQFLNYGREPLFLAAGGATELTPGVDAGLSAQVTLHSEATLVTDSDLAGNTSNQNLTVSARPVLRPVLGLAVDWGHALCAAGDNCWYNGLETAFVFRGYSDSRTQVQANDTIPGTVPPPGLNIAINTYDAYQPDIYALGLLYNVNRYRFGLTGEWQRWARLGTLLQQDTIKAQGNVAFRNVLVPRLGMDVRLGDSYTLTTGIAYEPSALRSGETQDVNYLDNDRIVLGLGLTAEIRDPWIFAYPVRLDLAYQYQQMRDRRFDLASSSAPGNPFETVTAGGRVQVLSASLTLNF